LGVKINQTMLVFCYSSEQTLSDPKEREEGEMVRMLFTCLMMSLLNKMSC